MAPAKPIVGEEAQVLHRRGGEQGTAAGPDDRQRHRSPVPRRGGPPATAVGGRQGATAARPTISTPRNSPRARRSWRPKRPSCASYIEELRRLGVEFKGPDGLCDFYSIMDGREVFLCWRLGEAEVFCTGTTSTPVSPAVSRCRLMGGSGDG